MEVCGMPDSTQKLRLGALVALVVGSMVGGGIFSLPQNIAASASAGATLIGWLITGVGMLTLAFVFQTLANRKPQLDGGVYVYAKAGFGEGNTLVAIICASVLLWLLHFLVLRGIKEAAFINTVTTIAKMVPLALFIIIAVIAFKLDVFTSDFWGESNSELGSVMDQVRNMMLVTVWVFIGIEGASIFSARAEKRSDVGKATVLGFIGVLLLLVLVNLLSQGIMTQAALAGLKNPSMAAVLEQVVGPWGAMLISIGLIVSLAGALLSWTLLCAEIIFSSAKDHTMPEFLRKENVNHVPVNALWLSNGLIQLFLIITLFNDATYLKLLYLATSMILVPYFWSSAYAVLLAVRGETYENARGERNKDLLIALISTLYAVWLVYAAGVQYLLLSALPYAPGALLFAKAKHELGQPIFTGVEKIICTAVLIGAALAAYGLYDGTLSL